MYVILICFFSRYGHIIMSNYIVRYCSNVLASKKTRDIVSMLFLYWTSAVNGGPTLKHSITHVHAIKSTHVHKIKIDNK